MYKKYPLVSIPPFWNNENIAEPTIEGIKPGATTRILHYRLTVYDDSRFSTADTTHYAQKVAMKNLQNTAKNRRLRPSYARQLYGYDGGSQYATY